MPDPTPPSTPSPWYQGMEAELIGHVQTKGWDKLDAGRAAAEAVKAHRAAEMAIGVPADQIIRLPKDMTDATAMKPVWSRLGAGAEAKDYEFSGVDFQDADLNAKLVEGFRAKAAEMGMPKAFATEAMGFFHKTLTDAATAEETVARATAMSQLEALKKEWGPNFDGYTFVAKKAAEALGGPAVKAAVEALAGSAGYVDVMKFMYAIGARLGEDKFIRDGAAGGSNTMTKEQAIARRSELHNDPAWRQKFLAGGAQEKKEIDALTRIIMGVL